MEVSFKSSELESKLRECAEKGITEIAVHDPVLASNKGKLLHFLKTAERDAPQLFISFKVDPSILDMDVCRQAINLNCSIEIPFTASENQNGPCLFDRKFYSRRAAMLNNAGLVFGADLYYADVPGDSLKLFKDRVDFTIEQYPNHIDFPQTENSEEGQTARVTGFFSAEDIRSARSIAFACRTFYSAGRAVPWFVSVLKPLKIQSSQFFADFAEWQRCNNCDYRSGFNPEGVKPEEIEKMQLLFLLMKYEEKNKTELMPVVQNIVKLNGAFSRLTGEGEESIVETQYNPDDLLGPESLDIVSFQNDVYMESCRVKIFAGEDGPDYKIL